MIRIKVGDKIFKVEVADNEKSWKKGLQDVISMESDEGLLFIYDDEYDLDFWMKDTSIPLDIVFIDSDLEVKSVKQGTPNTENYISEEDVQYVLEVNQNSGIKPEDELEFLDDYEFKLHNLYVIGSDGKPQMKLEGGERIFSRKNTRVLVNMAKRAYLSKSDSDYKRLGRQVFKYLKEQDTRKKEYVNN